MWSVAVRDDKPDSYMFLKEKIAIELFSRI